MCATKNKSLCVLSRKPHRSRLISANNIDNREASPRCSHAYIVCVCLRIPLHAVCPPGNRLGPGSRHPHVAGPHGDLAGGSHHNLESSSERSRGAHDGLETVTGTQTQTRVLKGGGGGLNWTSVGDRAVWSFNSQTKMSITLSWLWDAKLYKHIT